MYTFDDKYFLVQYLSCENALVLEINSASSFLFPHNLSFILLVFFGGSSSWCVLLSCGHTVAYAAALRFSFKSYQFVIQLILWVSTGVPLLMLYISLYNRGIKLKTNKIGRTDKEEHPPSVFRVLLRAP